MQDGCKVYMDPYMAHMASHYTRGPMTTLHEFGGVLGRPLDTFFWALTILWSRLLASHMKLGPAPPFPPMRVLEV
jgi:hypothetical protein